MHNIKLVFWGALLTILLSPFSALASVVLTPTSGADLSASTITSYDTSKRAILYAPGVTLPAGEDWATWSAANLSYFCAYSDTNFTGQTLQYFYDNATQLPQANCTGPNIPGNWAFVETDTGGAGGTDGVFFCYGGDCGGPPPPPPEDNTATSTVNQTETNVFYGYVIFFVSMWFIVWSFKKRT